MPRSGATLPLALRAKGSSPGDGRLRGLALALAVLTLGIGPWLGLPVSAEALPDSFGAPVVRASDPVKGQVAPQEQPRSLSAATGCSCREVVVDASNVDATMAGVQAGAR